MFSCGFIRVNPKPAHMLPSRLLKIVGSYRCRYVIVPNDMSISRIVLAAFVAGIAASITDWLFMGGDWLYKRYNRNPEIWRVSAQTETKAILWASPLPFVTCAVFAFACAWLHLHSFGADLSLALAVWLIAPLPLIIVNALFIKISPAIAISHALGWLVKLLIAGAAFALIAG